MLPLLLCSILVLPSSIRGAALDKAGIQDLKNLLEIVESGIESLDETSEALKQFINIRAEELQAKTEVAGVHCNKVTEDEVVDSTEREEGSTDEDDYPIVSVHYNTEPKDRGEQLTTEMAETLKTGSESNDRPLPFVTAEPLPNPGVLISKESETLPHPNVLASETPQFLPDYTTAEASASTTEIHGPHTKMEPQPTLEITESQILRTIEAPVTSILDPVRAPCFKGERFYKHQEFDNGCLFTVFSEFHRLHDYHKTPNMKACPNLNIYGGLPSTRGGCERLRRKCKVTSGTRKNRFCCQSIKCYWNRLRRRRA